MKVLQLDKYFYHKGGAETVFFNTIELLKANGHEVIPFCLQHAKNEDSEYASFFSNYPELSESTLGTKIKNVPRFFYNKEAAVKLEQLIKQEQPQIAHIHLLFNGLSVSVLPVLKRYNIPIVMTVHDYRLLCPAYTFKDRKGQICEKCIDRRYGRCILRRCSKGRFFDSLFLGLEFYFREYAFSPLDYIDKFIFVSKFSRSKHIEFEPRYEKVSEFLYNFTPDVKRTFHAEKKGKSYMLYLGRISEEKGIGTLLEAMRQLQHIPLKVVGTGPKWQDLKKKASPNVEFLGFKQGEELKQIVENAYFTIVPSEWYENNPLSVIESLAVGIPVIGSNMGGIPELIDNNRNGFLFEAFQVDDLIKQIKLAWGLDSESYSTLRLSCRKFVETYCSQDSYYNKLMHIYEALI